VSDFELTGKVCVVTGAGRGIGRGMAEGPARHGAIVVLSGRTRATLEETAAVIGERVLVRTADVSKETDVLVLCDAVLTRFGRIDVLVNNAGVNPIFKGSSAPLCPSGRTSSTSTSRGYSCAASISARRSGKAGR